MKNNFEVFDRIATHLLSQNQRSIDSSGNICMYRSPNGLKCAIGSIIPDDFYSPDMEGISVLGLRKFSIEEILPNDINFGMLDELQRTHDRLHPYEWHDELKRIANRYNLVFKL